MASPEHAWRGQRMGKAMQQLHRMANGGVITGKFDGMGPPRHTKARLYLPHPPDFSWASLASPVVDVGGGIGSLELALTKTGTNGNVKFTIFDIPETIENGKKVRGPTFTTAFFSS